MVEKRIRVPGTEEERKLISGYNSEMDEISKKIDEHKKELYQRIDAEKKSSPKMLLYKQKDTLENELKEFIERRRILMDERVSNNPMYKTLKDNLLSEKKKYNLGSYQEIEEQEKSINKKILTEKITPQQEKKYSSLLLELKRKKKVFSQIKEKEEEFKKLDSRMREIAIESKEINSKIKEIKENIMMIKGDITKISENKEKNEKIVEIENIIEKLKKKRTEIQEKKKKVIEEKKIKEDKYYKYKDELGKQLKVEKEKKEIQSKVREYEDQKNKILEEQNKISGTKFERIIKELETQKNNKNLMISINVVIEMGEIGVSVPVSKDEIEEKIKEIKNKKEEFGSKIKEMANKYKSEIIKLDEQIEKEKQKIENMPANNIKLLREEFGIKME